MNRPEAETRLVAVMRDVFDEDDIQYDDRLAVGDVSGWDSLSHVRFLRAVEKQFGLYFTSREVDALKSAGDVLNAIILRSLLV
jgi:acyl carrier protein